MNFSYGKLLFGPRVGLIVLVGLLSVGWSFEIHAQNYRWRRVDQWDRHQVFGLECGRGGPCFAAVTFLLEQGSLVRRSTDNGQSWHDVLNIERSSELFPGQITRVSTVGASTVFAGYSDGLISVSTDSGATWTFRRILDTGWVLTLRMLDENRGIALVQTNFALKQYILTSTEDAWRTTRELGLPDSVLLADTMRAVVGPRVYPTSAAMIGDDAYILLYRFGSATTAAKTTDRGLTWRFQKFGSEDIEHVRFADSLNGWAYGGRIYRLLSDSLPAVHRTTDGGESWELTLTGSRISDLNFRGTEVVAAADQKRVYSSSDRGITWRRDSAEVRGADIYYTAFPDSGDAIIGTASGTWLRSDGIPSATVAEADMSKSTVVWLDDVGQRLIVTHEANVGAIEVQVYDVTGQYLGPLAVQQTSPARTIVALDALQALSGPLFVAVLIDGRLIRTVKLQR